MFIAEGANVESEGPWTAKKSGGKAALANAFRTTGPPSVLPGFNFGDAISRNPPHPFIRG